MYQCITIHSISIHILIQQNEYQFISILMYHGVLINELLFEIDKTLKLMFYRK